MVNSREMILCGKILRSVKRYQRDYYAFMPADVCPKVYYAGNAGKSGLYPYILS